MAGGRGKQTRGATLRFRGLLEGLEFGSLFLSGQLHHLGDLLRRRKDALREKPFAVQKGWGWLLQPLSSHTSVTCCSLRLRTERYCSSPCCCSSCSSLSFSSCTRGSAPSGSSLDATTVSSQGTVLRKPRGNRPSTRRHYSRGGQVTTDALTSSCGSPCPGGACRPLLGSGAPPAVRRHAAAAPPSAGLHAAPALEAPSRVCAAASPRPSALAALPSWLSVALQRHG